MQTPRKTVMTLLLGAALAALAASRGAADPPAVHTMTIAMHELNGSGENGTATLVEVGGKVRVTIDLKGEPHDASEPAHVHLGHCPNIKAVPAYNVGPVVGGAATDVVDLSWDEIVSGRYAVNVHESAATLGKYVSCGDIGDAPPPPTDSSGY